MISYKAIVAAWDKFFFEPRPTEGIALFRIIWCSILFAYFLLDLQNINDFYGPHAIISLGNVKSQFNYPHMNIFHHLNFGYSVVYGAMIVYGLALITSIIGFYTRTSLLLVLILMTSFHQRNIWLLSSSELLMRAMTILLLCSACGHSLSIDAILNPKKRNWAPWALRLIQIQLSVVYLWTAWHKLKGNLWFDGTAIYYATRLSNLTNYPVPFLLDSLPFIKLMTWGTLVLEISLGLLIWVKEFRKPLILAGICFHLGIEYMMSIPFFEIIMMALLINFFTPEELKGFSERVCQSLKQLMKRLRLMSSQKEKVFGVE